MIKEINSICKQDTQTQKKMAEVTSRLFTIVKTGMTIVSYFGNVTACLFAQTLVGKFIPQ